VGRLTEAVEQKLLCGHWWGFLAEPDESLEEPDESTLWTLWDENRDYLTAKAAEEIMTSDEQERGGRPWAAVHFDGEEKA